MKVTDETRKARRKGKGGTNEFFTPASLVNKMCDKISDEDWSDPVKTFLEPCAGNGNFVVEIIRRRLAHGVDWVTALETLYCVELMADNVAELKERVIALLQELVPGGIDVVQASSIMKHNIVCSDFFKWDFEHWCPIDK